MKKYIVTYVIKRNHGEHVREKQIEAHNTKEARERFDAWYDDKRTTHRLMGLPEPPHPFHIAVRLARD